MIPAALKLSHLLWGAQVDASASLFPATALLLGFRHGFDWDHMAAIFDIVGTTRASHREPGLSHTAFRLSLAYVLGHAGVVSALGAAAILFSAVLPAWIDSIMERIVGVTLVALGSVMLVSVLQWKSDGVPLSRAEMLKRLTGTLLSLIGRANKDGGRPPAGGSAREAGTPYGSRTALSVGIFHGIGAETGTQALVLAAAAGASTQLSAVIVLSAFVIGLIASNSFIALFALVGADRLKAARPLLIASGITASLLSIVIGALFAAGRSSLLPEFHL